MKNALIAGVVGLLFMAGGFAVGFKMMPKPKAVAAEVAPPTSVTPPGAAVPVPTPAAISMDTLTKTSQSMMSLNLALAEREKHVAEREAALSKAEDELAAERVALDASHEKFKTLFNDFQSRLQLVEANQTQQLQKQSELFGAMGPDQSIDMVRTMDDDTITRLFSVMDTKPLAKLVGAWKTKYPDDSQRLLRALNNTAQVIDKNKIALNDPLAGNPNAPGSPAPAAEPAPAPESATPAPAPDATAPAAPDSNVPAPASNPPSTPAPLAPPPDANAPAAPAPSVAPATTDSAPLPANTPAPTVDPDVTVPGATAAAMTKPITADANPVIDPTTIPVAQPATPSDMGVDATNLQSRRAKPVNITTATTN